MAKKLISFLMIIFLTSAMCVTGFCRSSSALLLNGQPWETVDVITENGVLMANVKTIDTEGIEWAEYRGGERAAAFTEGKTILFEAGCTSMYVNAKSVKLDEAPVYRNSTLYIPLIAFMEEINYMIDENEEKGTINFEDISKLKEMSGDTATYDGMFLSDELLVNPSFEDDITMSGGWAGRLNAVAETVSDSVSSGYKSCYISGRTSAWSGVVQTTESVLSQYGKGKYMLKASVRMKDSDQKMNAKLVIVDTEGETHDYILALNGKKGEWVYGQTVADVEWKGDINSARFYIEANESTGKASEIQDFYVDDCSIKKLMTFEEYQEYVTKKQVTSERRADFFANASEDYLTVSPQQSSEILKNPYKGLVYYMSTKEQYPDVFKTEAVSNCKIVYTRYGWSALNPAEGQYNWDIIDKNIELLKKYDLMLGLGIGICFNYNSPSSFENLVPQYVYDAGAKYTEEDVGTGIEVKIPVWDDPIFLEKMGTFLDAFAEHYNGNPNIAYVDIRNYGNWGEWHMSNLPKSLALEKNRPMQVYYDLIDLYKNIDLQLISLRSKNAALEYAMKNYGAGIRIDGTMNPSLLDNHRQLSVAEGIAPAIGEWYGQPEEYYSGGKWEAYYGYLPIFFERVIKEGKATYMAMGYWNPEGFYNEFTDLNRRMANKVGYWFKPAKIQYPSELTKGTIKIRIKNDGVAPLFAGRQKKACVKLALADKNGNIIDTVVLKDIDPLKWAAGEYTDCEAEYEFGKTEGASKLLLGVFTSEELEQPNVRLGIKAEQIGNYYVINTMKKDDSDNFAQNKLFTEKSPYGEEGYGFRAPEHAGDDDTSTYWANPCEKGRYLEVDLGEYYNVSIMQFKSEQKCNVKYGIYGYADGKWNSLISGSGIAKGENKIQFRQSSVEKVRIVIEEDADAVLTVNDLRIN